MCFGVVDCGFALDNYAVWWGNKSSRDARPSDKIQSFKIPAELRQNKNGSPVAGYDHALVLLADGTVFGIGRNYFGQSLGYPTTNGAVVSGLVRPNNQTLSNVVAVAAGWNHGLAHNEDGSVSLWGRDFFGRNIQIRGGFSNIAHIAASYSKPVGLDRSGKVIDLVSGMAVSQLVGTDFQAFLSHKKERLSGLALTDAGSILPWSEKGVVGFSKVPTFDEPIKAVSCGGSFSLVLTANDSLHCWTENYEAYLTTNTLPFKKELLEKGTNGPKRIVAVSASNNVNLLLRADGTVEKWGIDPKDDFAVPMGLSNVVAIAAGQTFCIAITTNAVVAERFKR
ncbi:MAG TPA: hypothetical protein VFZ59_14390 [Verrucomicrobiae bacterium]|nr:hypothetical protein [Verrucomicrobiae bacterium]